MQYKILGEPLPVVECHLSSGETMITEKGAMSWMTPNMKMETTGGGKKQIYNVFKYIDTDKRSEVISFAYDIVGKTF